MAYRVLIVDDSPAMRTFVRGAQVADTTAMADPLGAPQAIGEPGQEPV